MFPLALCFHLLELGDLIGVEHRFQFTLPPFAQLLHAFLFLFLVLLLADRRHLLGMCKVDGLHLFHLLGRTVQRFGHVLGALLCHGLGILFTVLLLLHTFLRHGQWGRQ